MLDGDSSKPPQLHLSISNAPSDGQEQLAFALENTQAEVEWLRNQVELLQQELSDRLRQQQEMEQELQQSQQELVLMNQEIQRTFEAAQLTAQEVQEVADNLLRRGTPRKALTVLGTSYSAVSPEIGTVQSVAYDRRSKGIHNPVEQAAVRLNDNTLLKKPFRAAALKLTTRIANFHTSQNEAKQQRSALLQQTRQHIQQSVERIKQSKLLLSNELAKIRSLEHQTDRISARQQQIEQQLEQINTLQQQINDQKRQNAERGQPED